MTWERSRLRRLIVGVVCFKIAALVIVLDWTGKALSAFDLPKALVSRSSELVLGALVLVALYRWGTRIVPRTPLIALVVFYLVANVASALAAESRYIALFGAENKYLGLTYVVDTVVLFFAVALACRSRGDWVAVLMAAAVAILASEVYAWMQFLHLDPLAWVQNPQSRPFGTIGNAVPFSHLLSVAIAVGAATAVLFEGRKDVRVFGAFVAVTALALSAVVATRAIVLGIAATLVVIALLHPRLRAIASRRPYVTALGAAGGSAVFLLAVARTPLGQRLIQTAQGVGLRERILTWEAALGAFRDRPWLGWGVDGFAVLWPRYQPIEFARVAPQLSNDSAHSFFLGAAATTGIVGIVGLLGVAIGTIVVLARLPGNVPIVPKLLLIGAIAYWVQASISIGTVAVDWIPWVAAGGAAALTAPPAAVVAQRGLHPIFTAATLILAVVASTPELQVFDANREALATRHDADRGLGSEAIIHGRRAVELDGARASYWNELGRGYFAERRWLDAVDAFEAAHQRAPWQPTYLTNLGIALLQVAVSGDESRGGRAAAIAAATGATVAAPNDPEAHASLAEIAMTAGEPDVALHAGAAAMRIVPSGRDDQLILTAAGSVTDLASARADLEATLAVTETAALRVSLGQIALRQGDTATALASARRALALIPGDPAAQALLRAAGG